MINRGNYRRNLFSEKGGAEAFERVLGEAATKYGWRVHAYVVMRNHFHLALELTELEPGDAVVAEELIQYPWSSLPKWTRKDRPQWLDPSTVLGERGGLSDDAAGWRRYQAALVKAAEAIAQTGRRKRGELSRGWCLGSAASRAGLKQRMLEQGMTLDIERLAA